MIYSKKLTKPKLNMKPPVLKKTLETAIGYILLLSFASYLKCDQS